MPVITFQSPLLSATTGFSNYQWLYNGTTAAGTNADTLTAMQNGTYTVTDANGCTGTSAAYTVAGLSIRTTAIGNRIKIYPNPANDMLYVEQATAQAAVITVTDAAGKALINMAHVAFRKQELDVSHLAPGLYLLRLSMPDGNSAGFKFTKQ